MSYSQKQREAFARMQDARLPPNHMVLGTPTGLLLNELRHSPRYVLDFEFYVGFYVGRYGQFLFF
jgi:hypothetical protein